MTFSPLIIFLRALEMRGLTDSTSSLKKVSKLAAALVCVVAAATPAIQPGWAQSASPSFQAETTFKVDTSPVLYTDAGLEQARESASPFIGRSRLGFVSAAHSILADGKGVDGDNSDNEASGKEKDRDGDGDEADEDMKKKALDYQRLYLSFNDRRSSSKNVRALVGHTKAAQNAQAPSDGEYFLAASDFLKAIGAKVEKEGAVLEGYLVEDRPQAKEGEVKTGWLTTRRYFSIKHAGESMAEVEESPQGEGVQDTGSFSGIAKESTFQPAGGEGTIIEVASRSIDLFQSNKARYDRGEWFLAPELYSELFGYEVAVNAHRLSFDVEAKGQLPFVRLHDIQTRRAHRTAYLRYQEGQLNSLNYLSYDEASFHYPLPRRMIGGGGIDYSLSGRVQGQSASGILSLRGGAEVASGDLLLSGTVGHSGQGTRFQFGRSRWRYVFDRQTDDGMDRGRTVLQDKENKSGLLALGPRQFIIGEAQGRSPGDSFVRGVHLTNEPVYPTKSFTTFNVSGALQPGWSAELFINGQLAAVDATGSDGYNFDVPVGYGSNDAEVRLYGPYGEEKRERRQVRVPFSFAPPGELYWNVSVGETSGQRRGTAQGDLRLGLTKSLTLRAGAAYRAGREATPLFGKEHIGGDGAFSSSVLQGAAPVAYGGFSLRQGVHVLSALATHDGRYEAEIGGYYPTGAHWQIAYEQPATNSLLGRGALFQRDPSLRAGGTLPVLRGSSGGNGFWAQSGLSMGLSSRLKLGDERRSVHLAPRMSAYFDNFHFIARYYGRFSSEKESGQRVLVQNEELTTASEAAPESLPPEELAFAPLEPQQSSANLRMSTNLPNFVPLLNGARVALNGSYDFSNNVLDSYSLDLFFPVSDRARFQLNIGKSNAITDGIFVGGSLSLRLDDIRLGGGVRNNALGGTSFNARTSGSLLINRGGPGRGLQVQTERLPQSRRSGMTFRFYHDRDGDQQRTGTEPLIGGEVQLNGGHSSADSENLNEAVFHNLMPYKDYKVRINQRAVADPTLIPLEPSFIVRAPASGVETVMVPLYRASTLEANMEFAGNEKVTAKALAGLEVEAVSRTGVRRKGLTFTGGKLFINNLPPGDYRLRFDRTQLQRKGVEVIRAPGMPVAGSRMDTPYGADGGPSPGGDTGREQVPRLTVEQGTQPVITILVAPAK